LFNRSDSAETKHYLYRTIAISPCASTKTAVVSNTAYKEVCSFYATILHRRLLITASRLKLNAASINYDRFHVVTADNEAMFYADSVGLSVCLSAALESTRKVTGESLIKLLGILDSEVFGIRTLIQHCLHYQ